MDGGKLEGDSGLALNLKVTKCHLGGKLEGVNLKVTLAVNLKMTLVWH